MSISGIVIRSLPENIMELLAVLESSGLCEIHFFDAREGRIIITIEGETIVKEMEKFKAIQNMRHVLSACLAYSYCGDSYSQTQSMERTDNAVPYYLKE